jgi:tetratricopeptide (TPR) repeat protein/transcriptional regulator with XRE-family HTH domain
MAVAEQRALSFAVLLRRLREGARLTQEELAEAAGLSPRSVSDLERGVHRTARKDTAGLLADALSLAGAVRVLFVAAARGRAPAAEVLAAWDGASPGVFAAAATRALPRDIAGFTGRRAELARLLGSADDLAAGGGVAGIHAIDGMAGIGKTAFAVHAAHQLAGGFPDGQFFLPLHAHTLGQRPVEPADALASLLLTAGVPATQIPPGVEARAARWRDCVAGRKILLVLDDAASHDQVRPLLPGTAVSLVLITSRRRLTALEDAAVISLDTLPPGEAAALLARLAARPGLVAEDAGVVEITRLCGHLPLAIGMLASQLRHHPAWPAGRLAAELAAARDRLAVMRAENLSVAAAFGLSYADLAPGPQRLFRRLGLIPGPSFDAYAVAALDDTTLDTTRRCLDELYDQHLAAEPAPGRYQLHDLLREHARALAAADGPGESDAAIGRLLDYYLHTALAASQHITIPMTPIPPLPAARQPGSVPPLSTPGHAAAWLETEHANLHAAVGYAAGCGRFQHAITIPAVMADFLDARGHWDQATALHQLANAAARQAGDRAGQAGALTNLGAIQANTRNHRAAAANVTQALALYRDLGDRAGQANALNNLGIVQWLSGDYQAAAASSQQALELFRELDHRYGQGDALNQLGAVHRQTGNYAAAAESLQQALTLYRDIGHRLGQAGALIQLGAVQMQTGDYAAAAERLQQALTLYRDIGHRLGQADALIRLGTVQRLTGDYPAAAASQQQVLEQFRDVVEGFGQAYARNELGQLQQLTGNYLAAAASHHEALDVFRGLGHRLGEAVALNSLGELATRTANTPQAREHHTRALAIARDVGAAPEEACALEGLGHSHLQDGNPGQATEYLRQALAIYQRIGAPGARRVQETLHQHRLTSTAEPAPPSSQGNQPRAPSHPKKPSTDKSSAGSAAEQPDLREQPSAGTKQRERA